MDRSIGLIGVPTSAGAFAPGQELAPAALREAGLVDALREIGVEVHDHGDREPWRWRPDREDRRAQNLAKVVEVVRDTAERVSEAARGGEISLVLGGDCTVGIGTVAGLVESADRLGVVYFDLHADLNVPDQIQPGTLDWMGMAHMLAEDGARRELVEAGPRVPLLRGEQVVFLGWGHEQAQPGERDAIARRALTTVPVEEVAAGPADAAARALDSLGAGTDRVLVHFDVDVIDFTDTPLSEEVGRNQGLTYGDAIAALEVLLGSPRLAGLTVTELNPAHVEEGADSIERLAGDLARGLAGDGSALRS